jgi:cell division protein ZapA (FtsZ GTPase activity inhibitor)
MTQSTEETVSLEILIGEQTFRIRVPQSEEARWRRVEARANSAVKQILESGVVGGPRALAMATFQLATELDDAQRELGQTQSGRERLTELIRKIDAATGG